MNIPDSSSFLKKLLTLFLIVSGLYFAKEFLVPLAIAGVSATLFLPLCKWLEKKKMPKGLAVTVCVLVLLIAIGGVLFLLGWQVSQLTNDLAVIKQKVISTVNQVQQYILVHFGISQEKQSQVIKGEQPSYSNILQTIAGSTASLLTNLLLVVAYIFLFLYYRRHIRDFLLRLSASDQQEETGVLLNSIVHVSQQYLMGLSKMIVCLWIMYGIGFSIVGVKNPLFFAMLCGLLEIIPFIGNLTGTSLTLLVSAVQGATPLMLAGIIITYALIQFIQGWVLEPLIVGPHVKINPFTTIVALVLGELIWGIPGIFLAIPLIAMFKIVCDHTESLKPFGFLIGEIENGKEKSGFSKKIMKWFRRKK